jgi:hypothetical protein
MPVHRSKDSKGPYYQWGNQRKYYYKSGSKKSREHAKKQAEAQGVAIYATGWREPGGKKIDKKDRKKKKKRR